MGPVSYARHAASYAHHVAQSRLTCHRRDQRALPPSKTAWPGQSSRARMGLVSYARHAASHAKHVAQSRSTCNQRDRRAIAATQNRLAGAELAGVHGSAQSCLRYTHRKPRSSRRTKPLNLSPVQPARHRRQAKPPGRVRAPGRAWALSVMLDTPQATLNTSRKAALSVTSVTGAPSPPRKTAWLGQSSRAGMGLSQSCLSHAQHVAHVAQSVTGAPGAPSPPRKPLGRGRTRGCAWVGSVVLEIHSPQAMLITSHKAAQPVTSTAGAPSPPSKTARPGQSSWARIGPVSYTRHAASHAHHVAQSRSTCHQRDRRAIAAKQNRPARTKLPAGRTQSQLSCTWAASRHGPRSGRRTWPLCRLSTARTRCADPASPPGRCSPSCGS